jgi:glycosyltransferase involved in cell wall biosynthesis
MQIVINTRLLLKGQLEGIGRFTHETLSRLVKKHPDWHFVFLFDRVHSPEFIYAENVTPIELFPPARLPILIRLYYQWSVKRILQQLKPDLFYSPDGLGVMNAPCKQLVTMHDLNFVHFPENIPSRYRQFLPKVTQQFVKSPNTYINTVSAFSQLDIAQTYSLDTSSIAVIGNGVNDYFQPLSHAEKEKTRAIFSDTKPYFFFVGSIHARKNLVNMVKAFDQFKKRNKTNHQFLISGSPWSKQDLQDIFDATEFKQDVVHLGRIKEAYLPSLISAADALLYVSKFEGFGIPIIEAFGCETPVITSNTTSLPEIAGDAALLADPNNVNEIAEQMSLLHNNQNLRLSLIEKGIARKAHFTWDIMAERLSENICNLLNAR